MELSDATSNIISNPAGSQGVGEKPMSWVVLSSWFGIIDLFHYNFSRSGKQPEHRKLTHEL